PPSLVCAVGDTLSQSSGGALTPEAPAAYELPRAADAQDFRAQFYIGLARAQAGDPRAALQIWTDMVAAAPPDASWIDPVRERIAATARDPGIDPATITPSAEARAPAPARAPPRAAATPAPH